MSTTDSAGDIAEDAADLIQESGGLTPFIREYGIGGILYAIFLTAISGITSAGDMILAPFSALGGGISELIAGTVGEAVGVIGAGAATAIESFESGATAILGPFAFPFAVGIAMMSLYVFVFFILRMEFSPWMFIRSE